MTPTAVPGDRGCQAERGDTVRGVVGQRRRSIRPRVRANTAVTGAVSDRRLPLVCRAVSAVILPGERIYDPLGTGHISESNDRDTRHPSVHRDRHHDGHHLSHDPDLQAAVVEPDDRGPFDGPAWWSNRMPTVFRAANRAAQRGVRRARRDDPQPVRVSNTTGPNGVCAPRTTRGPGRAEPLVDWATVCVRPDGDSRSADRNPNVPRCP